MTARRFLLVPLLAIGLSACATRPPDTEPEALAEYREINDPLEPANRVSFAVHEAVDRAVLQPVAEAYRAVVPAPVRTGVGNALGNLRTPVTLINDVLQGESDRARITLGRFMVNTIFGIGGLIDAARDWGVPGHTEDFGQTLAVWGVGEGPFIFLPVLGPSNPRDLLGFGVDYASNPLSYLGQGAVVEALGWTRLGLTVVDTREGLLDAISGVRQSSLDPYATFRSAYRQRRRFEISNGGARTQIAPADGSAAAQPASAPQRR